MKILFISRFLPHPQVRDSGGQDAYRYIAYLSQRHAVSLIAFTTSGQREAVEAMRGVCDQLIPVAYSEDGWAHRLWRAWWRTVYPRVYGRVFSLTYRRRLKRLLASSRFDVVIVDGMMAQYGLLVHDSIRLLDEIDVYSIVAHDIYRREHRPAVRLPLLLDWLRLQWLELRYAAAYDGLLVRSEKDQRFLHAYLPAQQIRVLPPWFEGLDSLQQISPQRPQGNGLLFMGALANPKNIEAVEYFVEQILPLVRKRVADAQLMIVGSNPPPRIVQLAAHAGVQLIADVDDLTPYYAAAAIIVAPLLTSGGIIVKTLNGLAAARPTVATSAGNSGTGALPGRDLVIADDATDFAQAIFDLIDDPQAWSGYALRGREFIRRHYDWESSMLEFEHFLLSSVAARAQGRSQAGQQADRS